MRNIVLGLAVLVLFCGTVYAQSEVEHVSMIQLIATPEKYEGKYVRVVGFFKLEFEGTALYIHKEDYTEGLYKNGLWVDIPETDENKELSNNYVLIEGTFNSKDKGHRNGWSGSIQNVKRIQLFGSELVKKLKKSME